MTTTKPRYYVYDRATSQDSSLAQWNWRNPRFGIIDRTTNLPVDEAQSRYEARSAARGWNAGAYDVATEEGCYL